MADYEDGWLEAAYEDSNGSDPDEFWADDAPQDPYEYADDADYGEQGPPWWP